MKYHSYHIFMFPFRWTIQDKKDALFSDQISLDSIAYRNTAYWKRVTQLDTMDEKRSERLYNEGNYFYRFVHDALYDNGKGGRENLLRHFERTEPHDGDAKYVISTNEKDYSLNIDNICIDLFSTGVGVLMFYLGNDTYTEVDDILRINQFGRRVYPPFYKDKNCHFETAKSICINGLVGEYAEDFSSYTPKNINKPADFIMKLILEVAANIHIETVIDDRMYVMSWYKNDEFAKKTCNIKEEEEGLDFEKEYRDWYRYVFVDAGEPTCHNAAMFKKLVNNATYRRWQGWNSLYGISRYSFVMLSNADDNEIHLYDYFETEYVRMAELILVQKASVLKFSQEVTNISVLDPKKDLSVKVDSLYKEYIRFVNQIHFREVSAYDQAIELYQLLYKQMDIEHQVDKLDQEIDELHTYIQLREERKKSKVMNMLSLLGGIALPVSIVTGFFGMNNNLNSDGTHNLLTNFPLQLVIIIASTIITTVSIVYYHKRIK